MKNKYVVFDLDDTLIQEISFLKSAYKEIARLVEDTPNLSLYRQMLCWYEKGENVFQKIVEKHPNYSIDSLLNTYRQHFPALRLNDGAQELLEHCKTHNFKMGMVTDGRSVTQRNKLKAVGIEHLFDEIVVSEEFGSTKPELENFQIFMKEENYEYYYIANDTKKDFLAPNQLNWTSICLLDQGDAVHAQDFNLEKKFLPQYCVKNLREVIDLL